MTKLFDVFKHYGVIVDECTILRIPYKYVKAHTIKYVKHKRGPYHAHYYLLPTHIIYKLPIQSNTIYHTHHYSIHTSHYTTTPHNTTTHTNTHFTIPLLHITHLQHNSKGLLLAHYSH